MIGLLLCLAVLAVAFALGHVLFVVGTRNGDRLGDASVGTGAPDASRRGISFVVRNRGPQPVLIGASLRRPKLRLFSDPGQSVSVPRRTSRRKLLAGHHTVVYAIPAREAQTLSVPFPRRSIWRRAELVVAIGEPDRLRVVRQSVRLADHPAPARAETRKLGCA